MPIVFSNDRHRFSKTSASFFRRISIKIPSFALLKKPKTVKKAKKSYAPKHKSLAIWGISQNRPVRRNRKIHSKRKREGEI